MSPLSAQGEWELCWLRTAARMAGDSELQQKVDRELQKRTRGAGHAAKEAGLLPVKGT